MRYFLLFLLACLLPFHAEAIRPTQSAPHVVVTLKPLHALVSGVMQNVGTPILLAPPNASEHSFTLRPSQMQDLHQADAIFLVTTEFERFMEKPLETVTDQKKIHEIRKIPGLLLYPTRHAGEEKEKKEKHEHSATDCHLWLDPDNAIKIIWHVAHVLSEADSAHAGLYSLNAATMEKKLQALDKEIRRMFDAKDKTGADFISYLTYHDAYQYFERRYGLKPSTFITQNPEHTLGAKSIDTLQDQLKFTTPNCIFAEPQLRATIVHELAQQTGARVKVADPLGIGTPMGEEGYLLMMRNLATQFAECSRLQGRLRDFGQ